MKERFSRPPLARMVRIHEMLIACKSVTAPVVARELECSAKTVQRDLTFMRDQLRLPLDYDPTGHTFFYTHPINMPLFGGRTEAA